MITQLLKKEMIKNMSQTQKIYFSRSEFICHKADYLQSQRHEQIKKIKQKLNLDDILGVSSRKTYHKHFINENPVIYKADIKITGKGPFLSREKLDYSPESKQKHEEQYSDFLLARRILLQYNFEEFFSENYAQDLTNGLKERLKMVGKSDENFDLAEEIKKLSTIDDRKFEKEYIDIFQ